MLTTDVEVVLNKYTGLNPDNVPSELLPALSYAEKSGISDDLEPAMGIENATIADIETLSHCLDTIDDSMLTGWLTGTESNRKPLSLEYVAITCLTGLASVSWAPSA